MLAMQHDEACANVPDATLRSPVLALDGISVSYGPVVALDDVSVAFHAGRIHAVVGQNGAGKTTFGRVCAGLVRPDKGRFLVNGSEVLAGRVSEARALGVELVHQNFALPPSFTVAEVMEFGSRRSRLSFYSAASLRSRWKEHLHSLGLSLDLNARISDLPVEMRQGVEIAKALVNDARILILDEPTAVLTPAAIELLFDRVRILKSHGVTVVLILHKLREVFRVADTITVLRGGRLVEGPIPAAYANSETLTRSIIGADATAAELDKGDRSALVGKGQPTIEPVTPSQHAPAKSSLSLEVTGLTTRPNADRAVLDSVSLRVAGGEIVGVAGVEGNGQRLLVDMLAGMVETAHGSIRLGGQDVTGMSLRQRRRTGLRIIPFERNSEGLSLTSTLWENWSMSGLVAGKTLRFVDPALLRRTANESLTKWRVRFDNVDQKAAALSGGNAQKVILAREISDDARFVVAAQPTRGLDIAATSFVWDTLRRARSSGCGILLISSDLDELFDISDRIIVMFANRIVAEFLPPFRLESVGAAMTGGTQ